MQYERYVFNPLKGIFHINVRGLNKLSEIIKQTVENQAMEILAPQNGKLSGKDLCWTDITKYANFTVSENSK